MNHSVLSALLSYLGFAMRCEALLSAVACAAAHYSRLLKRLRISMYSQQMVTNNEKAQ